jgi:hypothetical protein
MKSAGQILRFVCFVLVVGLALAIPGMSQSSRGAVAGTVSDSTGAVVPGATVVASQIGTGAKSQTVSTSAGTYRLSDLAVGAYNITTTAKGFQSATASGIQVTVNSTASLNVTLQVGSESETINVDASGLRVETETSDISGTISNKQIEDLPLSLASGVGGLRSPETFVFLLPGTTGPGSGTSGNTGNGVFFSRLSGGQAYGAEVLLDGASIQRSENGSSFDETSPSIEALQEFKVTTSTPSAEFGRTTSGIESFSTKSGTNSFHGTAYAIVKNRIFDANNWFNDGYAKEQCAGEAEIDCQYKKAQDSKYDFGGVFSGPVKIPHLYNGKDRSFFLFAWEKYQLHLGQTSVSTVPTTAELGGNFSDILGGPAPGGSTINGVPNLLENPCTGQAILYNQIFDPATSTQIAPGVFCRMPFANNTIPSARFSQAAQKLIAGLPAPNQAPQSSDEYGYLGNYSYESVAPNTNTTYTIRIDQNLSDRSKIFASYNTRQNFKLTAGPNLPGLFNSQGYIQTFTTHYTRAGWDYSITPTLLNHVNLGYNRTNSVNLSAALDTSLTASSAGVANDHSVFYPVLIFPSPDQPTTLGQQQNGDNIDNGIRLNDIVSWQKGRSSIRIGVDYRHQQYSVIDYNVDDFNFYRDQTAGLSNSCCYSGAPYASLLLGEVGNGGQTVYNVHPRWNSQYIAGFFEDDMKVSKNLTLNIGLRYDVDVPRKEANNETSNFSLTAPDAAAGNLPGALVFGTNCHCNAEWANTWKKDVAPRLGFAYVLPGTNGKAALRGGAGIIYGPLQYNDFGADMTFGYNQSRSFADGETATTGGAFTPAFRLDSSSAADPTNSTVGFPNVSYAPSTDPTQLTSPNGLGTFSAVGGEVILPKDGRPSMTSNWSLQLQDEIAQDLIFSIGYIGEVAQNLRSGDLSNINNINPSYFSLGDKLSYSTYFIPTGGSSQGVNSPYSTFTGPLGQALRPFPQYDYIQGDCCLENLGHSSYNAMVVSLERRFRNGFNLQASYTWSKTLTDADSTIPFSYVSGNQLEQAQGSGDLKLDKAISVQNLPQQFSLSYLYQFPFGKGRKFLNNSRALDLLIGGWQVGAIQRYSSGQPIGFGCATGIPDYENCISYQYGPASNGGKSYASAAYMKNKNGPSAFNGESWFKPAYRVAGTNSNPQTGYVDPGVPMAQAAFVDENHEGTGWARPYTPGCAPAGDPPCSFVPFQFGNIPRETEAITGPLYKAEDVSLLKDFSVTQKVKFELKGEAFDLFNRHRMGLPDQSPGDSSEATGFGIPTVTDYGPRNLQVTGRITF